MANIDKNSLEETIRKAAQLNIPLRTNLKLSNSVVSSRVAYIQLSIYQKYSVWFEPDQILNSTIEELAHAIEEILKEREKSTGSSDKSTQEKKADTRRRLNIVVVGRSGVGKSSFLNYAAGKKVFETGIGDPVTQSYFDRVDIEKPEKKVFFSLFDTKGIEAGNTKEWSDAVFKEIDRRDESDNIYDWFHTILFCIDASSKRIQPFEIETIKKISEHGSVLVLLTKKDLVTPDILDGLRKQIASEIGDKVQVLSVCNVNTRTRKGESRASGLEDVLRVSFLGLWEKMANLLPQRIADKIATINTKLEVDCDLSDLMAYFALGHWIELEDGTRLYPQANGSDFPGKKSYESSNRDVDASAFRWAEKKKEGYLPIKLTFGSKKKVTISVNEIFPTFFSNATQLSHYELDNSYYQHSIRTYLRLLKELFEKTIENFKNSSKYFAELSQHEGMVSEALRFYNDITASHFKPLRSHKTTEAIDDFKGTDYDTMLAEFTKRSKKVSSDIGDVINCFVSSGPERRAAEKSYTGFMTWLGEQSGELKRLIRRFVNNYSAELHSYGQYCIREDELSDKPQGTDHTLLRKMIEIALTDSIITSKEYMMLEFIAEKEGLTRADLDRILNEYT